MITIVETMKTEQQAQQPPLTADKKYLDPNPPLENRTVHPFKRIAVGQDSEFEPEFKKQNLEELQTDECNIAYKSPTNAKIDDKVKTDPKLVEPFIKAFNTLKNCLRFYPAGCRFRPSDDMMVNYYPKNKVLGQPTKALIIPEECDHIFSIPPRDLPGRIMRPKGPESKNLWTRVGEDTTMFAPQGNDVGIKRTYALTEQEEEFNDISLPGEIEPTREEWFVEEISLPPSVDDTDLVFCHVILNKIEKE
ncbi:unnamed protein product [Brassica oleracea]|uniref:NAC domain-containing protein n=2 Tax=Brassica oleracea TaxID=3712 RepID=A0A0D3D4N2_BRAOL|nr:unnamed protein product [Brassica oleracea]